MAGQFSPYVSEQLKSYVSVGETELLKVADPPLHLSGVARTPLRQTLSRLRSALKETV